MRHSRETQQQKWETQQRSYEMPRRDYSQDRENREKKATETHRGKNISYDSDSSDGKGVRSGINARPTSNVKEQLKYPHYSLGQVSGFIGQNLQFHQLSYEHFIAGELSTIIAADDPAEIAGRTELLQRISLWKLCTNVTWVQVRSAYTHIIRKIENKEIDWYSDWDRFEWHIYDKISPVNVKQEKTKQTKSNNGSGETVWFCKMYQKPEGCAKDAPHPGTVYGRYVKNLQHICATCWNKERNKRQHSESSTECPYKEM